MSNLGPYGGAGSKNSPWTRASAGNNNLLNQTNSLQQQIMNQSGLNNINTSGMVPFQQQQVFQNMGMQQQNLSLGLQQMTNPSVNIGGTIGTQLAQNQLFQQVTYPNSRALNATAFPNQNIASVPTTQNSTNTGIKQRVFTGTVTTVHDNFGFVDEDVFFQTSACVKGSNPMVGDKVLVEATYNSRMPFKWNATRIQVLQVTNQTPNVRNNSKCFNSSSSGYNAVPPPNDNNPNYSRNRTKASVGGRGRDRSRDRDRDDDDMERKKRREERLREREKEDKKSPLRRRSRSPKRRRSRIVPRYMVQIPKIALDMSKIDVLETRRRYANLYIPSDFFCTQFRWMDAFPADKPFSLDKPCSFHIMSKDVDPVLKNDAVLEPPDADYIFSAKVMLMSVPGMDEIYQKCCGLAEDKERKDRDSEEREYVHPTRLINFLVGLRGKNETMAIGGPWSPSLDGENPQKDPSVLIRTAIRTCRALTGIDLSNCTKWYRFVELYYRRGDSNHKGKPVAARVETVVLFLPDVWSCLPTRLEWDSLQLNYRKQLEPKQRSEQEADEMAQASDEKEEEPSGDKVEPTHYSQLDPKTMSVTELRNELKARSISNSGLKSQLIAKLSKALKSEAAKSEDDSKEENTEETECLDEKKIEHEDVKLLERERILMEKKYILPEQPSLIVHPSRIAKSGKFDCTVMSLSLLLDYRPEDTKEHSFEVSFFAELFNEMLMRDFGFNIYKALFELPEKSKEKEEKRKKDDDKKNEDKVEKKKDEDKKEDEKKKDDKEGVKKEDKEKKSDDKKKADKKKEDKRSDQESDEEEFEEDDEKDRKRDKDRRKRDKPKMYTKNKLLLLSFIYFDQSHCGYIFEKDIEDMLYTLGLSLSRAQVRKLVGKVVTRDSLHYRKLTDRFYKDDEFIVIDEVDKEQNIKDLALGNKRLLPIFTEQQVFKKRKFEGDDCEDNKDSIEQHEDGLVMFRGGLVDVGKLLAQLERSERARLDTEARMIDLKSENSKLLDKNSKSSGIIKTLNLELKEYKEKLKVSEEGLHRTTACSRLFQTTLMEIRDKIDPVLNSTVCKEEVKKEERKDESKSRWEKEIKDNNGIKFDPIDIDLSDKKDPK